MKPRKYTGFDRKLGGVIKKRRLKLKLRMYDLASLIGISYQQVSKYESGIDRVSAVRLLQIGDALDIPYYKLMNEALK